MPKSQDTAGGKVKDEIRRILMEDWDPIGIRHTPECHDEYGAYIGGIHRLLAREASEQQIVEHLDCVEAQQMLLPRADKSSLLPVAQKLRSLRLGSPAARGAASTGRHRQ